MIKTLMLSFCCAILVSCQTDPLKSSPLNLVVVEAYLYQGLPVDQIRLSHPLSIHNQQNSNAPISDAVVYLYKGDTAFELLPFPGEPGRYFSNNDDLVVQNGDHFRLEIQYKDQVITALTTVPPQPRIIYISKDTLSISNNKSNGKPLPLEIHWELNGGQQADFYFVNIFNVENIPVPLPDFQFITTAPQPIWSPPFTSTYYRVDGNGLTHEGWHQAKITSINQEYADLYIFQTQGDQTFTPLPSNIDNGLGIFTAFSVSRPGLFFVK